MDNQEQQKDLILQNESIVRTSSSSQTDEIDLIEIFQAIWRGKVLVVIVTSIFTIAAVLFAIYQSNIYRSSALVSPVTNDSSASGLGAIAGQFGGLASLAGINLGNNGADKVAIALATIKSRLFIQSFIERHKLLIPLMATTGWSQSDERFIYDDEVYDEKTKSWVRVVEFPKKAEPSLQEAYEEFIDLFSVAQDKTTSMVNISFEHYSPSFAKNVVDLLIKDLNETMREQDKKEAYASINYLKRQLNETSVANMQAIFYQLIEEQTKNVMLTQVKNEYVFKTIDPAQIPEEKVKPKRALIVIIGSILGGFFGLLIVLVREFWKKN